MPLFGLPTLLVALALSAQNYCVRPGATGNGDGTDWTNAFTQLPGSLVRGATYYVASGTYGTWDLKDPESGSKLITIEKATVGNHGTATGWLDSYASGLAQISVIAFEAGYYTIDGQTGGGPGSWDSGFGMQVGDPSAGSTALSIRGPNWGTPPLPTHITLSHLDVPLSSVSGATAVSPGVVGNQAPGAGSNYLTVEYCYFHDGSPGADPIATFWANNVAIQYDCFARLQFNATHHAEAILAEGDNQLTIRYNRFVDINAGTAVIYIGQNTNGLGTAVNNDFLVYGNILYNTSSTPSVGMGFIAADSSGSPVTKARFFNNTIYNGYGNTNATWGVYFPVGTENEVYNNLWVNSWFNVSFGGTPGTGDIEDYNTAIDTTSGGSPLAGPHDEVIASGDPFVNRSAGDFRLSGHTHPGLEPPSPYNVDMLGHTTAADGVWDRGAMQYSDVSANPSGAASGNPPPGDVTTGCACNAEHTDDSALAMSVLLAFVSWRMYSRRRRID